MTRWPRLTAASSHPLAALKEPQLPPVLAVEPRCHACRGSGRGLRHAPANASASTTLVHSGSDLPRRGIHAAQSQRNRLSRPEGAITDARMISLGLLLALAPAACCYR